MPDDSGGRPLFSNDRGSIMTVMGLASMIRGRHFAIEVLALWYPPGDDAARRLPVSFAHYQRIAQRFMAWNLRVRQ